MHALLRVTVVALEGPLPFESQNMAVHEGEEDGQDEPKGENDVAGRDDVCHKGLVMVVVVMMMVMMCW